MMHNDEALVEVKYLDPPPQQSRKVVSCCIFIFPARVGPTNQADLSAYENKLQKYVTGLRRVIEITRDYMPTGYYVRLYIDSSVPRHSPRTEKEIELLRHAFPQHLERVAVRAVGPLKEVLEDASKGNEDDVSTTTFLPASWRFLAAFDTERPLDVVHVSDLDTAPFVPFTPSGQKWEQSPEDDRALACTSLSTTHRCALGRAMTLHQVEACPGSGTLSFKRTPSSASSSSILPVSVWDSMLDLVLDVHFRAFLKTLRAEDSAALRSVSTHPAYVSYIMDLREGRATCGDDDAFARALSSEVTPETTKALRYLRVLMLPSCDGHAGVPPDFRAACGDHVRSMADAGLVLNFQYGVDELMLAGLLKWLGPHRTFVMNTSKKQNSLRGALRDTAPISYINSLSKDMLSMQFAMGRLGWEQTYGRLDTVFVEVWLRIMAFGVKALHEARNMADAHYTMYRTALGSLGVTRSMFVDVLTPRLAGVPWNNGQRQQLHEQAVSNHENDFNKPTYVPVGDLARKCWNNVFKGQSPVDVDPFEAWNSLFMRFTIEWIHAWVFDSDLDPAHTTGLR